MRGRCRHARPPKALAAEMFKSLYRVTPLFTGRFMAFTELFMHFLNA